MIMTEYIRSLNSNYERLILEKKPDENKYQYCILTRGGIKGLLSCNLRYIDGKSYLYYDITSKQNLSQIFNRKSIDREWMRMFIENFRTVSITLERFLLDVCNIVWNPEHLYQELENNIFSFMYIPYNSEENGLGDLLEFFIDHISYEDEDLVELVYKMYEGYEKNGLIYLQNQIYEDAKILDSNVESTITDEIRKDEAQGKEYTEDKKEVISAPYSEMQKKQGLRSLFEGRRKKQQRQLRESYENNMIEAVKEYAVAEENSYDDDYGKTVFIDNSEIVCKKKHGIYNGKGELIKLLEDNVVIIGKMKGEVDIVLDDPSVSRVHAKISKEGEDYYIEDVNSTNGLFKNGLRLQPYEKRKLLSEDEIQIGRVVLIYR